jgi:hypothetical protein
MVALTSCRGRPARAADAGTYILRLGRRCATGAARQGEVFGLTRSSLPRPPCRMFVILRSCRNGSGKVRTGREALLGFTEGPAAWRNCGLGGEARLPCNPLRPQAAAHAMISEACSSRPAAACLAAEGHLAQLLQAGAAAPPTTAAAAPGAMTSALVAAAPAVPAAARRVVTVRAAAVAGGIACLALAGSTALYLVVRARLKSARKVVRAAAEVRGRAGWRGTGGCELPASPALPTKHKPHCPHLASTLTAPPPLPPPTPRRTSPRRLTKTFRRGHQEVWRAR